MKRTWDRDFWIVLILLAISAVFVYTNGELWPSAIFLGIAGATLVRSKIVEKRRAKREQEKQNPTT